MRIFLVRHARTADCEAGLHQADSSVLSENGLRQTRKVAERLKSEKFDKAIVSPFKRTRQTWEEIAKYHPNLKVEFNRLIVECSKGIFIGKPREIFHEIRKSSGKAFGEYRPEGGESFFDLEKRAMAFWKQLLEEKVESILVVSHGAFITALLLHISKLPPIKEHYDTYHPKNTGVTIIDIDKGKHEIKLMGCTKHLE